LSHCSVLFWLCILSTCPVWTAPFGHLFLPFSDHGVFFAMRMYLYVVACLSLFFSACACVCLGQEISCMWSRSKNINWTCICEWCWRFHMGTKLCGTWDEGLKSSSRGALAHDSTHQMSWEFRTKTSRRICARIPYCDSLYFENCEASWLGWELNSVSAEWTACGSSGSNDGTCESSLEK
jgi:hypothetical protein